MPGNKLLLTFPTILFYFEIVGNFYLVRQGCCSLLFYAWLWKNSGILHSHIYHETLVFNHNFDHKILGGLRIWLNYAYIFHTPWSNWLKLFYQAPGVLVQACKPTKFAVRWLCGVPFNILIAHFNKGFVVSILFCVEEEPPRHLSMWLQCGFNVILFV